MKLETRTRRAIRAVHQALAQAYGPLPRFTRASPLDELVATILSQNTSDVNSHRAFASLKRRFPRWDQAANARPAEIARAIRSGGLANIKAPRIKRVLNVIRKREGRITLRGLSRMSNPEALEYLMSLPGVGIKTAACVLLFSLGRPVMPVDTHVYRVTRRLGWTSERTPIERAGFELEKQIPARWMYSAHIYLVWHGRRTCRAQRPLCAACAIRAYCQFQRAHVLSSQGCVILRNAPPERLGKDASPYPFRGTTDG